MKPCPDAEHGHCYINARNHPDGKPVNGWMFWERKKAFVEAEAHCVVELPDGSLIDNTPKPDGEKQILFLADPDLETPDDGEMGPANRRLLICDDRMMRDWLELAEKRDAIMRNVYEGNDAQSVLMEFMMSNNQVMMRFP
ncbi:hypothetical protein K3152_08665 [Qipengyuania sp. 1NDH17]|uniref:Uncharacterized protein n=1 Tax=Qipengyuania polymorpha TaxID=2867234 RepID=A0ABS7IXM6_9SPHN|nr:hypothetical protein [Qipengyuania polymorpha]MBX7458315.1 hypothetical protein [Qipengyuania polymorpha]